MVAGGRSGEALDQGHEVRDGGVYDFGGHGVDNHRLPTLGRSRGRVLRRSRRRLGVRRLGGDWGFLDHVGVFSDSKLGRPWALKLSPRRGWAAVAGGLRRLHGLLSSFGRAAEARLGRKWKGSFFPGKTRSQMLHKREWLYIVLL